MAAVAYKYVREPVMKTISRRLDPEARFHNRIVTGKRKARMQRWWSAKLTLLVSVPLLLILSYVGLTAEVTSQTYRLAADQAQQAKLLQTDDELRQRLVQLQSVERLEAAAAVLGMKEPARISVITLPRTAPKVPPTLASRLADLKRFLFIP